MTTRGVAGTVAWTLSALALALLSRPAAAVAQEVESGIADLRPRPAAVAVRLDTPPEVDGRVHDDPAWSDAPAATGFWQTTPDEGAPASERTEVRLGYTDEALYVGVICHDRDPDGIIVSDSRRDASLSETDSFQIILDTYRDLQSGFVFGTNPAGIQYDGQVTGEGGGSSGSGGGFNLNWDASWTVEAEISGIGWSAEFELPFRSLRYPREEVQSWGINFQRNIRRHNETAFWAELPRQLGLFRLSMAGQLDDLVVPSQRNLKLIPYALASGRREGFEGADEETDGDFGADLKWSVTPSLTLDATYNTDFAQAEADTQQINLDRFNLFFPEKRPFFLENAGQFSFGVPEEVELFFSRRIGIGPDGEEIPIGGGLRLSGKAGGLNLGLLAMRAEETDGVAPRNDFYVARLIRDLPNRSAIGLIFTDREGGGRTAADDDWNRVFGLDGRWGIGRYGQVGGFVAASDTPGLEGDEHSFRVGARYDSEKWLLTLDYTEVGDDFNPEIGFLARSGYRKPSALIWRRIRPQDFLRLQEIRPHVAYRAFWDFDGFQETSFIHVDTHWEFENGYEIHTGINFTGEGVQEPFEIFPGVVVPEGNYDHAEAQIVFFTNRGAPLSFTLRSFIGGFFGGDRLSLSPTLRWRVRETFNGELGWGYNDIELPGGAFETNLGRLRLSYSFTPKIFVEALVQYNDRADNWSTNLRFGWLQEASAGLYLVYNEQRDVGSAGTSVPDRTVILKYSRLIDLLR